MKYVIFLGDGMADDKQEELGGKTIIEAADKPCMDRIAKEGVCGLLDTVPEGMKPDSTVANLSVLGYDPRSSLEGRGVLEAAAIGVELAPTDLAARMNTIHIADGKIITHSAGNISTEESRQLVLALKEELEPKFPGIIFHSGVSYRHVLQITRPASKCVELTPPHDNPDKPLEPLMPRATAPEGEETATLLRDLIRASWPVLEKHPVNIARAKRGEQTANSIWPWSIGKRPSMKTFEELYGVKGAVVCAVDLIRGIGKIAGMQTPRVEGVTGLWNTNFEGKADAVIEALKTNDLVYVHVEAPDEAGHDGDMQLKIRTITDLDHRLLKRVMDNAPEQTRFAVLCDHPTPVKLRTHVHRPVPFAIMGPGIVPDFVLDYGEASCAKGRWPNLQGADFIRLLLGIEQ
ncbi:cofactor-independent phosphoglycerate mutase [Candidatus Sumerlaeota bacterium]|nr:cofactor-independent phosphoglycerate mutase [Candidatus Sumerlaeales bacterium]NLD60965.1 cofactor-independent phosphoglycerate mutase [Candidatus Sumerlaeota bacterium]